MARPEASLGGGETDENVSVVRAGRAKSTRTAILRVDGHLDRSLS